MPRYTGKRSCTVIIGRYGRYLLLQIPKPWHKRRIITEISSRLTNDSCSSSIIELHSQVKRPPKENCSRQSTHQHHPHPLSQSTTPRPSNPSSTKFLALYTPTSSLQAHPPPSPPHSFQIPHVSIHSSQKTPHHAGPYYLSHLLQIQISAPMRLKSPKASKPVHVPIPELVPTYFATRQLDRTLLTRAVCLSLRKVLRV